MTSTRTRSVLGTGIAAVVVASAVLVNTPAQALNGTAATDLTYAFTAKIAVADSERACTGALVDPRWVLTAASCLADATGNVKPGKPQTPTTITVGRPDLTQTAAGATRSAAELVPHPDRDLVMVRLATRVTNVKPVTVSSSPASTSENVSVTGYGRTKAVWVPSRMHAGSFTSSATDAATVGLAATSDAVICQGDAGGPVLRAVGGTPELLAVSSRSWQGGCLGSPATETRTGALATRVDNTHDWIRQTVEKAQGDAVITAAPTSRTVHLGLAGSDGALHVTDANYSTGKWTGSWTRLDGNDLTALTSVTVNNVVHIYGIGTDGRVYGKDADYNTGKWSTWGEVPGGATGARGLTASATGSTVHLQIIGADGALHVTDANYSTGKWTGSWTRIDPRLIKSITSTVVDNVVHIYSVGMDGQVYGIDANYNTGQWSDTWSAVPGGITA